jgi:hypothetical protein
MTPIPKLLTKAFAMAYSMLNLFFPAKGSNKSGTPLDNGRNAKHVV